MYVNEVKTADATICLPCINSSEWNTTIIGTNIYLGFEGLQILEGKLANIIPQQQESGGNYTGIENFVLRIGATIEQVVILIRVGAFRFLGIGKKELLWEAHLLLNGNKVDRNTNVLFESMQSECL